MPDPNLPRSLSKIEARTLNVPKSTPATMLKVVSWDLKSRVSSEAQRTRQTQKLEARGEASNVAAAEMYFNPQFSKRGGLRHHRPVSRVRIFAVRDLNMIGFVSSHQLVTINTV